MIQETDLLTSRKNGIVTIEYYCLIEKKVLYFSLKEGDYQLLQKEGGFAKQYNHKHKLL